MRAHIFKQDGPTERLQARLDKADLFDGADDAPFNLAGESPANHDELTEEAKARLRTLAEREARKAQKVFPIVARLSELIGNERAQAECRGLFD